jgi:2-polyprenylphenol 6-hydroxylase
VLFPLLKAEAETDTVKPRFALVGDAAHSVHPLAGQGANMGWLDVASLAEVLAEAKAGLHDPGSLRVLRRYERWRCSENRIMQLALDGLHHLFHRHDTVITQARNIGLGLVDHSGPIKTLSDALCHGPCR